MVISGEVTDRAGGRLPLLAGVGTFLAGLITAGLAPDMAVFLVGRALQGFGVGLLIVVMYVIVGDQYPERLRPTVFGAISAAWVIPSLVGPVVAGALAEGPGWRWVFLGIVPLVAAAVAALVPTLRRLRRPPDRAPARSGRRVVAAVATAVGVAALQWSLQDFGWPRLPALAGGLVLLALGLRALLPRGTVALRRGVPAVVGFRGLLAGAFFSVESLVPLTLTLVHGYSPTESGAPLTFGALGWAAGSFWQGRRPDAARHVLIRVGFVLVGVAAVGMAVVAQPWSPAWMIYPVWVAGGCGMGLAMSSLSVLLLSFSPPAERGVNSSALQLSDSVAGALCIGLAGALVAASARGLLPLSRAAGALDLLMLVVALGGAALAGRARRPSPASAPRRPPPGPPPPADRPPRRRSRGIRRPPPGPPPPPAARRSPGIRRSPHGRAQAGGRPRARRPARHAVGWRAMAYLDHAATTPMLPEAAEAVAAALPTPATPPRCTRPAAGPAGVVEESRERVAAALGARPSEVVFTGGGTESDNLAVKGIFWARRAADPRRRPGARQRGRAPRGARLGRLAGRARGRRGELAAGRRHGRVHPDALRAALDDGGPDASRWSR